MHAAYRVLVVEEGRVLDFVLATLLAAVLAHVEVTRVVPQPAARRTPIVLKIVWDMQRGLGTTPTPWSVVSRGFAAELQLLERDACQVGVSVA